MPLVPSGGISFARSDVRRLMFKSNKKCTNNGWAYGDPLHKILQRSRLNSIKNISLSEKGVHNIRFSLTLS